jgi:ATP-binding cassette subfamily G (WHITE) protein 2 (PDR)
VLYEGQQIYFGPTGEARDFFTNMGFDCPSRQTTADFLTSLTSPSERRVKSGYEGKVPRTPEEFAKRWQSSPEFARLQQDIEAFDKEHPIGGQSLATFSQARRLMQSKQQ